MSKEEIMIEIEKLDKDEIIELKKSIEEMEERKHEERFQKSLEKAMKRNANVLTQLSKR